MRDAGYKGIFVLRHSKRSERSSIVLHEKWGMLMKKIGQLAALLMLIVAFFGCAEKGPILIAIGYQEPAAKEGSVSKVTVAVSPLRDVRGKPASVLGKRTIPDGQENDLVVQGTVAEIATLGLKKALAAHGVMVKDAVGWDLTLEGMKLEGTALLLGGEVRTLWLESSASGLKTHLQASVQLKIVAGYLSEKRVIRTIDVSSKLDEDVLYSQERLEQILTEALSSAIDQIFKDEELKKRLQ